MCARLARALGLDSNPLRRASDRAEAWIRVGLLAVFLIAGPMAAHAAGGWARQMGAPERGAGAAPVHAVEAVLLHRPRRPSPEPHRTQASWCGSRPGGTARAPPPAAARCWPREARRPGAW